MRHVPRIAALVEKAHTMVSRGARWCIQRSYPVSGGLVACAVVIAVGTWWLLPDQLSLVVGLCGAGLLILAALLASGLLTPYVIHRRTIILNLRPEDPLGGLILTMAFRARGVFAMGVPVHVTAQLAPMNGPFRPEWDNRMLVMTLAGTYAEPPNGPRDEDYLIPAVSGSVLMYRKTNPNGNEQFRGSTTVEYTAPGAHDADVISMLDPDTKPTSTRSVASAIPTVITISDSAAANQVQSNNITIALAYITTALALIALLASASAAYPTAEGSRQAVTGTTGRTANQQSRPTTATR